jgi:hypothetical protein
MSHQVLIYAGRNGRANGILGNGYEFRSDRPCYPDHARVVRDFWWLNDQPHESIGCHYRLFYRDPYWVIDIEDASCAILFKLAWG